MVIRAMCVTNSPTILTLSQQTYIIQLSHCEFGHQGVSSFLFNLDSFHILLMLFFVCSCHPCQICAIYNPYSSCTFCPCHIIYQSLFQHHGHA